jgi:hypothetical protein
MNPLLDRLIEVNNEYEEFSRVFGEGAEVTMRHYFAGHQLLMKLDDAFARANGY